MVMLGLVALIALVILATTSSRRRRMQGQVGDVKLGEDGLLLAGELHIWKGWGARLEEVSVLDGNPPCLAFTYSTPSKNSRQITTVRVPIPRGKDAKPPTWPRASWRSFRARADSSGPAPRR